MAIKVFMMNFRYKCLVTTLSLYLLSAPTLLPTACQALTPDIPPSSLKIPPMVPEESVSTYLPSPAAPGEGIAVNIIYPAKPRYAEGAPVVVIVPAGTQADGLSFTMHAAQSGFAEIRFAFPGGGTEQFKSSGTFDNRGVQSQAALRDVLLFAAGKLKDRNGKTIGEICPTPLANSRVGAVGWSNGGNILLVTLGKFADQLPFISWLVFYESPLGALLFPPSLGGTADLIANRHYRQGSCATGQCLVDFRRIQWQADAEKSPGAHKKSGEPSIPGVVFLDENKNKVWEESFEYAFTYSTEPGVEKQFYPPQVTRALERFGIFSGNWPSTVATAQESDAYFQERDGASYIAEVLKKFPHLAVTIFGSLIDHMQRQPDHPHIALQYNSFLANKARWVRLNPDPVYCAAIAAMNAHNFVDNKPNQSIDAASIAEHLQPEGLVPDYVFVEAAIAELADRQRANQMSGSLKEPLVNYTNGAKANAKTGH